MDPTDEIQFASDEIYVLLKASLKALDKIMPDTAKLLKKMYDSLVDEGFTEDQAMRIVTNWSFAGQGK